MEMMEPKDVKIELGIALANVYKLMQAPDFPSIRITSKRWIVPRELFDEWLLEQIKAKKAPHQCIICGAKITNDKSCAKYCADCAINVKRNGNRERVRRYRMKHTNENCADKS